MGNKIVWRKKAAEKFENIVKYLKLNWSDKVALDFINDTERILELLKVFPNLGSVSKKRRNLKKFLISEQNVLVYTVRNKKIILINIYDTRTDPIKIKF